MHYVLPQDSSKPTTTSQFGENEEANAPASDAHDVNVDTDVDDTLVLETEENDQDIDAKVVEIDGKVLDVASAEDEDVVSSAKKTSSRYLRIARTLLGIIILLLTLYLIHWLLVNVFKINVIEMVRAKLPSIPSMPSIPFLSSAQDTRALQTGSPGASSTTSVPPATTATADLPTASAKLPSIASSSGSGMKRELSESVENSLVDLLAQFK